MKAKLVLEAASSKTRLRSLRFGHPPRLPQSCSEMLRGSGRRHVNRRASSWRFRLERNIVVEIVDVLFCRSAGAPARARGTGCALRRVASPAARAAPQHLHPVGNDFGGVFILT